MKRNKKIAVAGGIGSGKSELIGYLKRKGYPVYSCDEIYREISASQEFLCGLKRLFPDCVTDGGLDRKRLSEVVFSDPVQLEKLNSFTHPLIMERLLEEMEGNSGLVFAEVPLLFEGGFSGLFDGIIVVIRGRESRLAAVMERDGLSEEEVLSRMANQKEEDFLRRSGAFVIENDGTLAEFFDQIDLTVSRIEKGENCIR